MAGYICLSCERPFSGASGLWLLVDLLGGHLFGDVQRFSGGNFYIRFHAGAFPVGLCNGVDRARIRDTDREVSVDAMAGNRMGTAAGDLADNGGSLQVFEVIRKLFSAGKCSFRGEHKNRDGSEL